MAYRRTEKVKQRLAARHDALIAAARDLAAEKGMDAVQVAPVAERAGIAAGTVYRYFPSKVALVEALTAAVSEAELSAIRGAADAAPGPLSALAAAIITFASRAVRARRLVWALIAEPVDAEVDAARRAFRQAMTAEIAARLEAARRGGHLADTDPALAAAAIVGGTLEALVGPLAPHTAEDAARDRDSVQKLALFALRASGIIDARARGLVVQTPMPADEAKGSQPLVPAQAGTQS